jgi:hypothetical protein
MNFGEARRKVEEIKQSAITFPSDNLFIQIGRAYYQLLHILSFQTNHAWESS